MRLGDAALPDVIERKRFRPTCAVGLLLSGVTPLSVMERLGHRALAMLERHYAKMLPPDWARSTSAELYLGVGELRVGEWVSRENAWDKSCLRLLLLQAKRFGKMEEVREAVLQASGTTEAEVKLVDSF